MNTLSNIDNYFIPNTLDGINIIQENINDNALLVDGTNQMLADLNAGNHVIKNLDAGIANNEAVNVGQLNAKLAGYLLTNGTNFMTGNLNLNLNNIINLSAGTANGDAVNKFQMDSSLNLLRDFVVNNYVDLASTQTITGLKTFSNQVTFNGTTKTNLVATDIPNAGTRTWLDSTGIQSIAGTKTFANSVNINGPALTIGSTTTTTLNNGANCNNKNLTNVLNPVNAQDASTKNYVDTQTANTNYLLRNGTLAMTGALNMSTTNKIINLADPTTAQDASTKNYVDNSLNLLRAYVDTQDTALKTYTDSSLNLLRAYVDTQDTALKAYTDSSLNLLRAYVDTQDTADRTYVDASLNLKVNRSGDTMTGNLNLSLPGTSTNISKQLNIQNNNNSIWFNPYFSAGSYNPLVATGSKGIIFSNGTKETGDLIIGPWTDYEHGIQLNSTGQTVINKNTSGENNFITSSSNILTLTDFNVDRLTLTYSGASSTIILLVNAIGGPTTACGKTVNISIPAGKNIIFQVSSGSKINYNGVEYTTQTPTISSNLAITADNTLAGYYTSGAYKVWDSYDQLTIKSNLGTTANSEFTGIKFLNTNTDAGLIRVETDLAHNNSVMRFYTRVSNALTLPLDIASNINAYKPIIRNAWSSGELIQSKIFNQNTSGSGVLQLNGGSGATTWKSVTFTMLNTVTDSDLYVEVFAPYHLTGSGQDRVLAQIRDFTSSTEQEALLTGQYWDGNGGGGTRSGIILPMTASFTPNLNTSNKTRTIEVRFNNYTGDILYICRIVNAGNIVADCNYYTIKISEYKK